MNDKTSIRRLSRSVLTVFVLALALGACREEEQNRTIFYVPGKYQGEQDKQLSQEALNKAKARVVLQGGATASSSGGQVNTGVGIHGSDVRPPTGPSGGDHGKP